MKLFKKSILLTSCLGALFALGYSFAEASGADVAFAVWGSDEYEYTLDTSITKSERTAIITADNQWNNVDNPQVYLKESPARTDIASSEKDDINIVYTDSLGTTGGVLAQARCYINGFDHIIEADIAINESFAYSTGSKPSSNTWHLRSIMTHEMGHALGIGHLADKPAVMYATLKKDEVKIPLSSYDEDAYVINFNK
ncbi:matrixin family metalloprotease [Brevibacillus fortis]|uniref:matrixin family metalloprotease n=1 Tax=Brevibacillus fortis TaxID=2126352 RepID=UPI002E1FE3A7|nr:matrixin family metalloprotease [Brevibacillus fortis]